MMNVLHFESHDWAEGESNPGILRIPAIGQQRPDTQIFTDDFDALPISILSVQLNLVLLDIRTRDGGHKSEYWKFGPFSDQCRLQILRYLLSTPLMHSEPFRDDNAPLTEKCILLVFHCRTLNFMLWPIGFLTLSRAIEHLKGNDSA